MTSFRIENHTLVAYANGKRHVLYPTPADGSCHRPGTRGRLGYRNAEGRIVEVDL